MERDLAAGGIQRRTERDLRAAVLAVARRLGDRLRRARDHRPRVECRRQRGRAPVSDGVPDNPVPAGWQISGGTSAASPQVAGVLALANAARANAGKKPLGNVNPILYSLPSNDYRDVRPIAEGTAASGVLDNNQLWQFDADGSVSPGPVGGFPTLAGWDMTTGFGSPIVGPFVASLAARP